MNAFTCSITKEILTSPIPEGDTIDWISIYERAWFLDPDLPSLNSRDSRSLSVRKDGVIFVRKRRVANGTRTRNSQNHNLELYH